MPGIPRITVLMAVHNGEPYLREAVESILVQTCGDFELLIVDDASTDGGADYLRSLRDPRIHLVHNEVNSGLTVSLNKGLSLARGEFIARMDSDDVSLRDRLDRQTAFLARHPEAGVCGSWVRIIGEREGDIWRYPTEPEDIRCHLLFECPLAHPSVMMRRERMSGAGLAYDPRFRRAQDYDLWVRSVRHFPIRNIPEVLLLYRVHPLQAGIRDFAEQEDAAARVVRAQLEELGLRPTPEEFEIHRRLGPGRILPSREFVEEAERWLRKIGAANGERLAYPEPVFSRNLGRRWYVVCRRATSLGAWIWRRYRASPLSRSWSPGTGKQAELAVRCLTRRG